VGHEEGVLPPVPSRSARSLFAYLVTNKHAHTRDLLAGTFWPDFPENRARRRLSHAMWQLQTVLSEVQGNEPFILTEADTVEFNTNAPYWLDVEEFEALIARGELADLVKATDLYRGDFLAGFYDEWQRPEQERLRQTHLDVLGRLVNTYKARGDHASALVYARRAASHDPLREDAHREVMRLCFLLGQFNEALQQFDFCSSVLEEELGAVPDSATVALYDEIIEHRSKGDRPFVPDPAAVLFRPAEIAMVGRATERATVVDLMNTVMEGQGGILLVEGETGIGVSRFLAGLAEDAHWRGLGVMKGRARQMRIDTPFDVLKTTLEDGISSLRAHQIATIVDPIWLVAATSIVPSLQEWIPELEATPLHPNEEADRLRHAVAEILVAVGQINPHVVFIDDVQWADEDTLATLKVLSRRLRDDSVLLILGYHSDEARNRPEVWEALLEIDTSPDSRRLVLAGLTEVETAELIRAATGPGHATPELVASVYHQTAGNPLLVLESLREMSDQATDIELPLSATASTALQRRIGALPPQTRIALEAAAILDDEITPASIAAVSGLETEVVLSAVDEGVRRALLVDNGNHLSFIHGQMRKATYQAMAASQRRSFHRLAAVWLEKTHPNRVEEIAIHFDRADEPRLAMSYYGEAARAASDSLGYESAARHYANALRLVDKIELGGAEATKLMRDYESVLDLLGRRDEQDEIIDRLDVLATSAAEATDVAERRAWLLAHSDRFGEAIAEAERAVILAETAQISVARGMTIRGLALSWSGRPRDAIEWLDAALQAQPEGDAAQADIHYAKGVALSSVDDPGAELELLQSLEQYEQMETKRGVAEVLGLLATVRASQGQADTAERDLLRALEICRNIGYRHGEGTNLVNLASLQFLLDRPARALSYFEQAKPVLELVGNRRGWATVLSNSALVQHRILGDDETARADATAALDYFEQVGNKRGSAHCRAILADIAVRSGDLEQAEEYLGDVVLAASQEQGEWFAAQKYRSYAGVALAMGDHDKALRYLDQALEACRTADLQDLATVLEARRAVALSERGLTTEAVKAARTAVAGVHGGVEQPYLVNFALFVALEREGPEAMTCLGSAYHGLMDSLQEFDTAQITRSLQVPEHQAIVTAWAERHPVTRLVSLSAKSGQGSIEVEVTVDEPADRLLPDRVARRRSRLSRMLAEIDSRGAVASTEVFSGLLGVSTATVRRDLADIRQG